MRIRVLMTRHSAFYSPIACAVAAGFLEREGIEASFGLLQTDDRASGLPLHFALINQLDGFFLAGRHADPDFEWKKLEGAEVLADHLTQPLVMLRHSCRCHGVDWSRIRLVDAGAPDEMEAAFRAATNRRVNSASGASPSPPELRPHGHDSVSRIKQTRVGS